MSVHGTGRRELMVGQQGIWNAQQLDPTSPALNIAEYLEIHGRLDTQRFDTALRQAVSEADAYHLRFESAGDAVFQDFRPTDDWTLHRADFRTAEDPRAAAEEWMRADLNSPFDMHAGPYFVQALLTVADDAYLWYQRVHHAIGDGYSGSLVASRCAQIYTELARGVPAAESAFQSSTLLMDAESAYRASEDFERDRSFWADALGDSPEPPSLARHPSQKAPIGSLHTYGEVGPAAAESLRRLARRLGTGPSALYIATAALCAARITASDEVVLGIPVLGRKGGPELRTPGMMANILPVRLVVRPDMTLGEFVREVSATVRAALRHQRFRYEDMLRDFRRVGRGGLFSAVVNVMPLRYDLTFDDLAVTAHGLSTGNINELSITVREGAVGKPAALVFDSASGALSEDDLATTARVFQQALEWLEKADTEDPLYRWDVLSSAEREQVLGKWNDTAVEVPVRTVPDLFEAQVACTPDAVAVVFEGVELSYAELAVRSNRLARLLIDRGVGPESVVGLVMDRSVELVVAVLAVVKAGGAYLPVDPTYPVERIDTMLADAGAVVVLSTKATAAARPGWCAVDESGLLTAWDERPVTDEDRTLPLRAEHPAYVIYTSGSTGRPKGVVVAHAGLVNRLAWMQGEYRLGAGDRVLQKTPIVFDVSVWELFWPLTQGAVLVVARPGGHQDPEYVAGLIRSERVSVAHFVPSMLGLFVAEPSAGSCTSLRLVFSSGEALAGELSDRFRRLLRAPLHNLYGPTEASVDVTAWACEDGAAGAGVPIGRPVWNTRVFVLDGTLRPVPVGVPGELYLAGVQLARGYLGQSGLTSERFVACPFGVPGERMYRTGDVVRWSAEGVLEYLGRTDDQVKVRGFRIELGEIEAVVATHPSVERAVVLAREDVPGDRRLAAYVVCAADADVLAGEVRELAARLLPSYMVPAAVVVLGALPLTPNGKVDRKALPAPEYTIGRSGRGPSTLQEEILCGVFAEVLGLPSVGVDDDFFELGGHSLLAVSLVEKLRERGVGVNVRALFTTPTVAGLAAGAVGAGGGVQVPANMIPAGAARITPEMLPLTSLTQDEIDRIVSVVAGGALNVADVYPLAPLQEGLLFHHLLADGGKDPYVHPTVMAFDSRERLDAFTDALQQVVNRHDILRTSIVWEGRLHEPVQVVWRHADLSVGEVTLDPEATDPVRALLSEVDHSMDLGLAPLVGLHAASVPDGSWLLLFRVHHVILDRTATEVIRDEVAAILTGHGAELPKPLPFRTFVAQARAGLGAEEHELFFGELLGDVDEPTAPYGVVDVRGDGMDAVDARLEFSSEVTERLREVARRLGASPATVVHVAWARVLSAISGRDDVVFGTVLFGRMNAGTGSDRVAGPFMNMLPVRVRVSELPVRAAVAAMREQLAALLEHEHAPLALAQRAGGVSGDVPLFTTMLNYRHSTGRNIDGGADGAMAGTRVVFNREHTNYPLSVAVDDDGNGLSVVVDAVEPVDPDAVAAMMRTATENLVAALETASDAGAELPLSAVEVLGEAEQRLLLEEWNDTDTELDGMGRVPIPELFEAQVARTPDAVAVVFEGVELSYAELDARSNRLARLLIGRGVGPESVVGLVMDRSVELVVAVLAVVKAGGAYLPVDPSYPVERVDTMLADAGAVVVLTTTETGTAVSGAGWIAVDEPGLLSEWDARPVTDGDRRAPLRAEHPAYVIYTSGSTGRPKGVVVAHAGLVNRLAWMQGEYRLGVGDRVLQKTPIVFDVSVWELFWPLTQGAVLVVARPGGHQDPEYVAGLIRRERVSVAHFVPSMLGLFVAEPSAGSCTSLRLVFSSGEALAGDLSDRFRRLLTAPLHNLYGPTEASVDVTAWACEDGAEGAGVPIGRPVWNTRVFVLDGTLRPVPVGVPGELYLAGVQLARGYLGQPGLTSERFVACPFGAPAERMYRTGDVVRWSRDGDLEYLGRTDDQVKVRGFRIELGEIEAAVASHSSVERAVVLAREDVPGDKRLVAYVVSSSDPDVVAGGVRELAAGLLPPYMVPAAVVVLEALPLTPNGKVDRKALPAPEYTIGRSGRGPSTLQEEILCGVFAEVLGLSAIGVDDDFFELGGHSLLATRLINRIRTVLGTDVPLRAVFDAPSPGALAERLDNAGPGRAVLAAGERPAVVPLSFAQQRLWFLDQLEGPSATYNLAFAARLKGSVEHLPLQAAFRDVLHRHEALRTVIRDENGAPFQVALDGDAWDLSVGKATDEDVSSAVEEFAHRTFDLANDLPLRACLLALGSEEHVLIVVVHHIAADGWSVELLAHDVSQAYAARLAGDVPQWAPLPVQYADYTLWQQRLLGGVDDGDSLISRQLGYWREALAELPESLDLPTDRPRPARSTYRGADVALGVNAEIHRRVTGLARSSGTTLHMVVQAALAVLLSRLGAGADIPIGTPIAGRTDDALGDMVGFFVNTLVTRTDLSGNPTFTELLGRVRDTALDAHDHQDVPFERLVEDLSPVRSMARHPLFQVMLTLQNNARPAFDLPGVDVQPMHTGERAAKFDLAVELTETFDSDGTAAGVTGTLTYATDLFDAATAQSLADRFTRVLGTLTADPDVRVGEVEVMDAAERHRVLREWNDTTRVVPAVTLTEVLEEQAARTPEARALIDADGVCLTYRELHARANRLARLLVSSGTGPDDLVGIMLRRSPDMVVAMLAVLKSGAAYVPIDPEYPADRIEHILRDAQPTVLLTDGPSHPRLELPLRTVVLDDPAAVTHLAGLPETTISAHERTAVLLPDHPAYVIYTSGSTGRPKGVVVPHRGLVNYVLRAREVYQGLAESTLVHMSVSFDAGVTGLYGALAAGGCLQLAPSGAEALTMPTRDRAAFLKATPSHLPFLDLTGDAHNLPTRQLMLGAEPLHSAHIEQLRKEHPDLVLVNHYGPTEATVGSLDHHFTAGDDIREGAVPVGRPMWNMRAYVLDAFLSPVAPGVRGELYLAGVQLARGYLGRAGLTAERFVADPFGVAGDRMYRTGDVVRWTADGVLECLGRTDDQVKVRGFRIEPGEVEAALVAHEGVGQAAVVVREDAPGDKRLVGYLVPANGGAADAGADFTAQVKAGIAAVLPDYMIPSALVVLDRLPVTPNGKLDRRALPAPVLRPGSGRKPANEKEELLCGLFAEVLGLPEVGPEDNFFELGGHSLLATRLINRIRTALNAEITLRMFFHNPVPAQLAKVLGERKRERPALRPRSERNV